MQTSDTRSARTRRAVLYGTAAPVLAALVYVGFVRETDADVGTLVGAANIQLRLAHGMPALDKDGGPLAARVELLDAADVNLHKAIAQLPDSPIVVEHLGFLCHLRGEFAAAAAHYHRARGLPDCGPEQRDVLVFNEARMLASAGRPAAALEVLVGEMDEIRPDYRLQYHTLQAEWLHRLGREDDATAQLELAAAADEPVAWLEAGRLYGEFGHADQAETLLGRAAEAVPIANYHRARLKLAAGDVDTSLRLLGSAAAAVPAEVRRLVREDPTVWQGVAEDPRFRELIEPKTATPGR